jgi:Fuc2NAc and GlcNAc transferase
MRLEFVLLLIVAVAVSYLLTGLTRQRALKQGVLDIPNERSSHVMPTPRGGGLAIVITATLGMITLALVEQLSLQLLLALAGGGAAIAMVGFIDDRRKLSAKVRLAVHFGAALWALAWLGGLPPLRFGEASFVLGWEGYLLGAVGIVWTLNLFNFMDGIDGIAASEAVFIVCAGSAITLASGISSDLPSAALVLAAACCGFLLWNWPPAKIFMGDVGSGYLGYGVAVLAIAAGRDNPVALLVWVILGAIFFVDATVTLVRRVARRERASEAHRSHAYQWLARRWGSHRSVTLATIAINVLWLLPCAFLAASKPRFAGWIVVGALLPICIGALLAGAGRREARTS